MGAARGGGYLPLISISATAHAHSTLIKLVADVEAAVFALGLECAPCFAIYKM